jgi:dUTPase
MAVLNPSDKFAQLVLNPIETPQPVEVATKVELFKDKETARGDGGFGSTGNT